MVVVEDVSEKKFHVSEDAIKESDFHIEKIIFMDNNTYTRTGGCSDSQSDSDCFFNNQNGSKSDSDENSEEAESGNFYNKNDIKEGEFRYKKHGIKFDKNCSSEKFATVIKTRVKNRHRRLTILLIDSKKRVIDDIHRVFLGDTNLGSVKKYSSIHEYAFSTGNIPGELIINHLRFEEDSSDKANYREAQSILNYWTKEAFQYKLVLTAKEISKHAHNFSAFQQEEKMERFLSGQHEKQKIEFRCVRLIYPGKKDIRDAQVDHLKNKIWLVNGHLQDANFNQNELRKGKKVSLKKKTIESRGHKFIATYINYSAQRQCFFCKLLGHSGDRTWFKCTLCDMHIHQECIDQLKFTCHNCSKGSCDLKFNEGNDLGESPHLDMEKKFIWCSDYCYQTGAKLGPLAYVKCCKTCNKIWSKDCEHPIKDCGNSELIKAVLGDIEKKVDINRKNLEAMDSYAPLGDYGITSDSTIQQMHREMKHTSFQVKEVLGKGSFGKVYKVLHKRCSNKTYDLALKMVRKDQALQEGLINEVLMEKDCLMLERPQNERHLPTYLARGIFTFQNSRYLYYAMESLHKLNMFDYITKERKNDPLTELEGKIHGLEVMFGLNFLHESPRNIVHRDLKLENIVLDKKGHCKIIDFGGSKRLKPNDDKATTYIGTAGYLAPEMIRGSGYNWLIDIWAWGIILYEFIEQRLFWGYMEPTKIENETLYAEIDFDKYPSSHHKYRKSRFKKCSDETVKLLKKVLTKQPEHRLKALEILESSYYKNNEDFKVTYEKVKNGHHTNKYFKKRNKNTQADEETKELSREERDLCPKRSTLGVEACQSSLGEENVRAVDPQEEGHFSDFNWERKNCIKDYIK